MRNKQYSIVIILVLMFGISSFAQQAGGAAMYSNKNIIENVANSKDHTTFVTAVKTAGLVETLQGDGPFTVLLLQMPHLINYQKELLKRY